MIENLEILIVLQIFFRIVFLVMPCSIEHDAAIALFLQSVQRIRTILRHAV